MLKTLLTRMTGLAIAASFLIASLAGMTWFYGIQHGASEWVRHTTEVQGQLYHLLGHLDYIETSERGYLLTGDDRYLAPYASATEAISGELKSLSALTSDNIRQQQALSTLARQMAEHALPLRRAIDLIRAGDRDGALASVRVEISKAEMDHEMDQMRSTFAQMVAEENGLLEQRQHALDRATYLFGLGALFVFASVVALALVAVANERGQKRQLVVSRDALALANEQLVRESVRRRTMKRRYLTLFDASPLPMVVADLETSRILAVNQASVEQYGWSREEQLAMTIDDFHLPEDLAQALSLRAGKYVPGRTRLIQGVQDRTKDGKVIDVEVNVRSIDFKGKPALLAVVQDVTARKAAEKHLAQVERLYRVLFKASPHPMAALDGETLRFLAVSDSAVEQYGWSREELTNMSSNDLYSSEDLAKVNALRPDPHLPASSFIKGVQHRRKDGTFFDVEIIMRPIDIEGRPGFLAVAEDVTARLASERGRVIAEDQQRQGQKLETIGQLTGGIAHDFNNILFVILANTDALLEVENLSADTKDRLDHIDKAVQRASTLTGQLLAFSRKQPLHPQQTDLTELVTETGTLLKRALGAQIEIESVFADHLCVANVDRSQLQTALVNLCINARDAMPTGGKLLIETHNVVLEEEDVVLNPDATAGTYAVISVTDTGEGIPPETLRKVFEPFFTTKEAGKGTGLGLSMVYGFIKQSKGHVKIYSEVGKGTSVKLYLPCSGKAAEAVLSRDTAPISGGTERILVVEDEPQVRASMLQQLRSLGYAVSEAADGAGGVSACEAAQQPYALLLTDVVMPGLLNGKALASEVTRRWPKTKIVFMSGFTEVSSMRHNRLDEGSVLLSKPFRRRDLARIVRLTLDGTRAHAS